MENLTQIGLVPWIYRKDSESVLEPKWFEKQVDGNEMRFWARNQLSVCIAISVAYLVFICIGPIWMKNRKPYNLQKALILWNFSLGIFSIVGASRMLPTLFEILAQPNGFYKSTCVMDQWDYPFTFWGFAFTLSKIAELVDTVFIVLRKKPLIFLHWYHHLSMVWVTFYLFSEGEPISRWSAVLNYSVHSIMYSYFTLKAMNIKLSRNISMLITSLQIIQFVVGLSVHFYSQWVLVNGGECFRTSNSITIYYIIGISYLSLFIKLFYNSYVSNPKAKTS